MDSFLRACALLEDEIGIPDFHLVEDGSAFDVDDWVQGQAVPEQFLTWMKGRLLDYKREHYSKP